MMALYVYTDGKPKQSNGQMSLDPSKRSLESRWFAVFTAKTSVKNVGISPPTGTRGKKRERKKSSSSLTFESFTCFPKPKITKREKKTWLEVPKDHRKRGLKRQKRATREDREGQWQCSVTE